MSLQDLLSWTVASSRIWSLMSLFIYLYAQEVLICRGILRYSPEYFTNFCPLVTRVEFGLPHPLSFSWISSVFLTM
jgi:hypothetical protein